jgi:hypothetical protein
MADTRYSKGANMKLAAWLRIAAQIPLAVWLKAAAQLPFGLIVTISLFGAGSEILNGNYSQGIALLAGAVLFGTIILFMWKSPSATGGKLVFGGILFLVFSMIAGLTEENLWEYIIGGSALISGLLLLLAVWATPKDPR